MDFEIITKHFLDICSDDSLSPTDNKFLISILNDYEEGVWRYNNFENFIWNNIALTALSHKERASLVNKGFSELVVAAKNLRILEENKIDHARGSEIAEIALYAIMRHHFKAISAVPKIFYKQNNNDTVKGADSVHIVLENDNFTLWFGEAKFYNSIEDERLYEIVKSVRDSLQTVKLKKENSIILGLSDLSEAIEDKEMVEQISGTLSPSASIDKIKPILNIPILLLYECETCRNHTIFNEEYKKSIENYHTDRAQSYFQKQLNKKNDIHLYEKINFHLILFPVPSKDTIVDTFIDSANFYRNKKP